VKLRSEAAFSLDGYAALASCSALEQSEERMPDEKFWISTGDISEHYETLNLVFASTTSFLKMDYPKVCREALDQLAQAAIAFGANGVIWISFQTADANTLYASGTAVRVI
jgi:putative heavy-metal-binding protein